MPKPALIAVLAALALLVAPAAQAQMSNYIVVLQEGADVDGVVQEHATL